MVRPQLERHDEVSTENLLIKECRQTVDETFTDISVMFPEGESGVLKGGYCTTVRG